MPKTYKTITVNIVNILCNLTGAPTIAHLIAQSIECGLTLSATDDGRLAIVGRTAATPETLIDLLRTNKAGVVAYLKAQGEHEAARDGFDLFVSKALDLHWLPSYLVKGVDSCYYGPKAYYRATWPVAYILARALDRAGVEGAALLAGLKVVAELQSYCAQRYAPHEEILAMHDTRARLPEVEAPLELPDRTPMLGTATMAGWYARSTN
jgi:hypothetical protein